VDPEKRKKGYDYNWKTQGLMKKMLHHEQQDQQNN